MEDQVLEGNKRETGEKASRYGEFEKSEFSGVRASTWGQGAESDKRMVDTSVSIKDGKMTFGALFDSDGKVASSGVKNGESDKASDGIMDTDKDKATIGSRERDKGGIRDPSAEVSSGEAGKASASLKDADQRLRADIEQNYHDNDAEKERMLKNLDSFEDRCKTQGTEGAFLHDNLSGDVPISGATPISDATENKTLDNVSDLIEGRKGAKLGSDESEKSSNALKVAYQEIASVANPVSISQGGYPTCSVTTSERIAYFDHPDEATGIVTSLALTGKAKFGDKTVVLPDEDLRPDQNSKRFGLDGSGTERSADPGWGVRSYASQLFQDAALTYIGENDPLFSGKGKWHGEHKQHWDDGTGIGEGPNEPDMDFLNRALANGTSYGGDAIIKRDPSVDQTGVTTFTDEGGLLSILKNAQDGKTMPVEISVNAMNLSKKGAEPDGKPNHAITIDALQQDKDGNWLVYVNNNWDSDSNKWMTLDDLYSAT